MSVFFTASTSVCRDLKCPRNSYFRVPKVQNFPDSIFLETKPFQIESVIPIYN